MTLKRRILWVAIMASTFIYAGVSFIVLRPYPQLPLADVLKYPLVIGLYAAALATYIASFIVSAVIETRGKADVAFIVRLALLEATTIYGLVAAFLVHDWRVLIPPFVITFIGLARVFPSAAGAGAALR